jgi:hypothetical protein
MPDVNGWDIIRMLRSAGRDAGIITADGPWHD